MSIRTASIKDVHSYVGFANFPNQVFRRAVKNGFEFTLMVVGCSGLGKSTFLNSLFSAEIYDPKIPLTTPLSATTEITEKTVRMVENGVSLDLTLVDTPGFGDAIDNNKCWDPIINFIERKYFDYFSEETKIERSAYIPDKRVHLCLYFVAPTGHGLKPLDIEVMKKLHDRVNVVPIIGKADTMTTDELNRFKAQILKEIDNSNIKLYKFPEYDDEDERKQFGPLRDRYPFAVVGSNQMKEINGKRMRFREYPWGITEVENLKHNDFIAVRDMIIRTNLIDLIVVTKNVHYENFRFRQLSKGSKTDANDRDPFTQMEHERKVKEKELEEKKTSMENLDEREKENRKALQNRRLQLEQLMNDVVDLRKIGTLSRQESRSGTLRSE
ncbi:unnamed protein product [Dracunculus medinensis]|uniref:Septin n=1 Tax=Dracunculus medinensis TaxID=318479 RepID=A0A0N4ULZ3_DRAME|nr:unnamed protein product [Dracunculus medinensis]